MTQSWEGKDLRYLKNIVIQSYDLWSHLPRLIYAVTFFPIIPSVLLSFHNTYNPSYYKYF